MTGLGDAGRESWMLRDEQVGWREAHVHRKMMAFMMEEPLKTEYRRREHIWYLTRDKFLERA